MAKLLFITCLTIFLSSNLLIAKIIPQKSSSHKQETEDKVVSDNGTDQEAETDENTESNNPQNSTETSKNTDTDQSTEQENKDQNAQEEPPVQFKKKLFPALGYQLNKGPLWSVVCLTKDWGRIPGKLDGTGHAFFTYDYSIYYCDKYFKVNGKMVWNTGEIPKNCSARGKQNDNSKPLYNVIAVTQYGNIPGKASSSVEATFSVDAIRHSTKTFYWIC